MSNSLDPDQARRIIGPDLGPNSLPRLSADNTGRQRVNVFKVMSNKIVCDKQYSFCNVFLCLFVMCRMNQIFMNLELKEQITILITIYQLLYWLYLAHLLQ